MNQRIMIAMAIAATRACSSPTSRPRRSTSPSRRRSSICTSVRSNAHVALMLITHDMGVVAQACDRVMVVYAGQQMEISSGLRLAGGGPTRRCASCGRWARWCSRTPTARSEPRASRWAAILEEPVVINASLDAEARQAAAREMMAKVDCGRSATRAIRSMFSRAASASASPLRAPSCSIHAL